MQNRKIFESYKEALEWIEKEFPTLKPSKMEVKPTLVGNKVIVTW